MTNSMKISNKNLNKNIIKKTKNISQTTQLKRINNYLYIYAAISFCIFSIYPLVNLLITFNFMTEGYKNLAEIGYMYEARAQLTSNFSSNFNAVFNNLQFRYLPEALWKTM